MDGDTRKGCVWTLVVRGWPGTCMKTRIAPGVVMGWEGTGSDRKGTGGLADWEGKLVDDVPLHLQHERDAEGGLDDVVGP